MDGFFFFVFWLLLAVAIGAWANSRGRSPFGFGLLSFIFSPLLAAIVLLVTVDKKAESEREAEKRREHEAHLESIRAIAAARPVEPDVVAAVSAPAVSVADELEKLATLRDKGVLSEGEFLRMKLELLQPKR